MRGFCYRNLKVIFNTHVPESLPHCSKHHLEFQSHVVTAAIQIEVLGGPCATSPDLAINFLYSHS